MSATGQGVVCARTDCVCVVSADFAHEKGEQTYCGPGCADGEGCGHPDCNCGRSKAPIADRPA